MTEFDPSDLRIGASQGEMWFSGANEINDVLQLLCEQVTHKLLVLAPRLDLPVFTSEAVQTGIERIVAGALQNHARFLIADDDHFRHCNGRIIALCRRFSSYVGAHKIIPEYATKAELFVVADDTAYIHQPIPDQPRALTNFNDPGAARRLTGRFHEIWERSETVPELFSVGL